MTLSEIFWNEYSGYEKNIINLDLCEYHTFSCYFKHGIIIKFLSLESFNYAAKWYRSDIFDYRNELLTSNSISIPQLKYNINNTIRIINSKLTFICKMIRNWRSLV